MSRVKHFNYLYRFEYCCATIHIIFIPSSAMESGQVSEWLCTIDPNYEQYIKVFEECGFDAWDTLHLLSIDDFVAVGIKSGHAIRINKELKALRSISPYSRSRRPSNLRRHSLSSISKVIHSFRDRVESKRRKSSIANLMSAVHRVKENVSTQNVSMSNMRSLETIGHSMSRIANTLEEIKNNQIRHQPSEQYFYGLLIYKSFPPN